MNLWTNQNDGKNLNKDNGIWKHSPIEPCTRSLERLFYKICTHVTATGMRNKDYIKNNNSEKFKNVLFLFVNYAVVNVWCSLST